MNSTALAAAFAVLLPTGLSFAQQPQTNQPLRVALDLTDGSRILGRPGVDTISIRTSYAEMSIPLKRILAIALGDDRTASFELQNGDRLKGLITLESLKLDTLFGSLMVGMKHISALRVITGGSPVQGLVLHYSFDRGEGDSVPNAIGNSSSGVLHGARLVRIGKIRGACSFDGADDYIDAGNGEELQITGDLSVFAWIKGSGGDVISKFTYMASDNRAWAIYASGPKMRVVLSDNGAYRPGHNKDFVSSITVFDDKWHHVGFVFDASESDLRLYVDGVRDAKPTKNQNSAITSVFNSPAPVRVGAKSNGSLMGFFHGLIDEVRIYSRTLSSLEVRHIYGTQD